MCGKSAFGGQCASRYEYRSCNNMVGPLHQNQHCTVSAGFVNIHGVSYVTLEHLLVVGQGCLPVLIVCQQSHTFAV